MAEFRHVAVRVPRTLYDRGYDPIDYTEDGAHRLNTSKDRFAIVHSGKPEIDERLANTVERLVQAYIAEGCVDRAKIAGRLHKLHAKGRVLWPVALFFGESAIQGTALRQFTKAILRLDPIARSLRRSFEEKEGAPHANWKGRKRSDAAAKIFRIVAGVMYSSTEKIECIEDFSTAMFDHFVSSVTWKGYSWPVEKEEEFRKSAKTTANFFAVVHDHRRFGADALKAVGGRPDNYKKVFALAFLNCGWLKDYGQKWIDSKGVLSVYPQKRALVHLYHFLQKRPFLTRSEPHLALSPDSMRAMLKDVSNWTPKPHQQIEALNQLLNFFEWLRRELIKNGLPAFEVILHPDDFKRIAAKAPSRRSRDSQVAARGMPIQYHTMLKKIITDGDFAWPKSLRKEGHAVHFTLPLDAQRHGTAPIFCPVVPRLLFLLLDLPIRTVQARRLDSGEGDAQKWDAQTKSMQVSTGQNAGHWEKVGARRPHRGVACEGRSADGKTITGLWINSNKTQDAKSGFDEESGYFIPWEHHDVLANIAAMREWQETYNPVRKPLPHFLLLEGVFGDDPSALIADNLPERFYLFRYPRSVLSHGSESPCTYAQLKEFFLASLDKLEQVLREDDPTVRIITKRNRRQEPLEAIYTMHGMRSSLLTALSDGGVPLDVLSRLVAGHASILMTLKYIKHNHAHVSEILSAASVARMDDERAAFPERIQAAGLDAAKTFTARVSDDALEQARTGYSAPTAWTQMDYGLCPNQATKCNEGGPKKHSRDQARIRTTVGGVPGGPRNCVRCRFFITGVPFMLPLWAHSMSLGEAFSSRMNDVGEQEKAVEELRLAKHEADRQDGRAAPVLVSRVRRAEEELAKAIECRNAVMADLYATLTLIEKVRALAREASKDGGDPHMALLVDEDEVPAVVAEPSHRFTLVDAIVQASRVFPSIRSAALEREHVQFLDRMLYWGDMTTLSGSPLTTSEASMAALAMAKKLLIEQQASEVAALMDGRKTLQDLDLQESLEQACREAVGRPIIMKRSLSGAARPVEITLQAAE